MEGRVAESGVLDAIDRRRGGGRPLDPALQSELGGSLGQDLSGVRLHTDSTAGALAQGLGAHAFTSGSDVFFSPASYRPDSPQGRRLLVHELTHVGQQEAGRVRGAPGEIHPPGHALEREADAAARGVAAAPAIQPSPRPGHVGPTPLQRQALEGDPAGATPSTPAAPESLSSVLWTVATNPAGALTGGIWLAVPDRYKGPLIHKILDRRDTVLNALAAIFTPLLGGLAGLFRALFAGFLDRMAEEPEEQQVWMSNRLATLFSGRDATFVLSFLKGLAIGVWDIVRMPYDLVVGLIDGVKWVANWVDSVSGSDLEEALGVLSLDLSVVGDAIRQLVDSPARALEFVMTLWDTISAAVGQVGRGVATAVIDLLHLPSEQLGEEAGRMSAGILFDLILSAVTAGVAAILRRAAMAVVEVAKLLKLRRALVTAIRLARGVMNTIHDGIGRLLKLFSIGPFAAWLRRFGGWLQRVSGLLRAARVADTISTLHDLGAQEEPTGPRTHEEAPPEPTRRRAARRGAWSMRSRRRRRDRRRPERAVDPAWKPRSTTRCARAFE